VTPRFIAFNDSDFRLHDEAAFNAGWDALLAEIGPLVADLYTTNHTHENLGDRAHNRRCRTPARAGAGGRMSESTTKRLRRENAALYEQVKRLSERIDTHRNKEIKLLNDILELRERVRELEGGE
jgi:hypothetical protein